MMKRRIGIKPATYFLLVIMAVLLIVIVSSLRTESLYSKLLPLAIASCGLVLALVQLAKELLGKEAAAKTETEGKGYWRGFFLAAAWLVGYTLFIYLLGFIIATFLFILAYMKSHAFGWFLTITVTVLTTALVYGVFILALQFHLYEGLLFGGG